MSLSCLSTAALLPDCLLPPVLGGGGCRGRACGGRGDSWMDGVKEGLKWVKKAGELLGERLGRFGEGLRNFGGSLSRLRGGLRRLGESWNGFWESLGVCGEALEGMGEAWG